MALTRMRISGPPKRAQPGRQAPAFRIPQQHWNRRMREHSPGVGAELHLCAARIRAKHNGIRLPKFGLRENLVRGWAGVPFDQRAFGHNSLTSGQGCCAVQNGFTGANQ